MKRDLLDIISPFAIMLLLLILLEIVTTALFPVLGMSRYRIPFHILFVLFLGFKLESPWLSVLILVIQYFHSFFSVEGWAIGTLAGIIVCTVVSYLRELIHLSSPVITVLVVELFQLLWFVIIGILIYLKLGEFSYILDKLWRFLPESLVISFLSPFLFNLLDKIWKVKDQGMMGEES